MGEGVIQKMLLFGFRNTFFVLMCSEHHLFEVWLHQSFYLQSKKNMVILNKQATATECIFFTHTKKISKRFVHFEHG